MRQQKIKKKISFLYHLPKQFDCKWNTDRQRACCSRSHRKRDRVSRSVSSRKTVVRIWRTQNARRATACRARSRCALGRWACDTRHIWAGWACLNTWSSRVDRASRAPTSWARKSTARIENDTDDRFRLWNAISRLRSPSFKKTNPNKVLFTKIKCDIFSHLNLYPHFWHIVTELFLAFSRKLHSRQ